MNNINGFEIDGRKVGAEASCLLIAEIGQAHDGSLGMAHAFLDAAANAGADAIKFQTHIASEESTLDEPFRVPFSYKDKNRFEYWKRMEFTQEEWAGLAQHARDKNLIFLSSPFSEAAVKLLTKLDMPAWKVGSGEAISATLMGNIQATRRPILLSTGMSSWGEIDESVEVMKQKGIPHALFQCTSEYPTVLERVGINVLSEMQDRYDCPVGLSDHSGSIYPSLMALSRGCNLLELHVTFDKGMFGPDSIASLTFDEFRLVKEARNKFLTIDSNPVDKDNTAKEMNRMRSTFGKSLAPARVLEAGTVLEQTMLVMRKPATGLKSTELAKLVGRKLARRVTPDRLIKWSDLEA